MSGRLNHVSIGAGRPILAIHGGKLDHRHMVDAIEPVFSDRDGWQRIYVDLPGCGASTGFDSVRSQDDVLAAVVEFAATTSSGVPLAVIGESRGSYIAQGLAYARPELVAGLALIVPGGISPTLNTLLPEVVSLIREEGVLEGLEPAVRGRAEYLVVQTAPIIEKIRQTKVPAAAAHDAALEARVQESFEFSFHEAMLARGFEQPSLIVSGRQDSIAGFADAVGMLGAFPRATYALLDCAGHSLSWERPELFRALMQDWLKRLEAA